jgi:hypothetical protein
MRRQSPWGRQAKACQFRRLLALVEQYNLTLGSAKDER